MIMFYRNLVLNFFKLTPIMAVVMTISIIISFNTYFTPKPCIISFLTERIYHFAGMIFESISKIRGILSTG